MQLCCRYVGILSLPGIPVSAKTSRSISLPPWPSDTVTCSRRYPFFRISIRTDTSRNCRSPSPLLEGSMFVAHPMGTTEEALNGSFLIAKFIQSLLIQRPSFWIKLVSNDATILELRSCWPPVHPLSRFLGKENHFSSALDPAPHFGQNALVFTRGCEGLH